MRHDFLVFPNTRATQVLALECNFLAPGLMAAKLIANFLTERPVTRICNTNKPHTP